MKSLTGYLLILLCFAPWVQAVVLLPEGFVLNGIEGTVVCDKNQMDSWTFIPSTELTYMKTVLPAGSSLPILPSGGLDQIRLVDKDKANVQIKVWGILTLYGKQNYLFPMQILPLTTTQEAPAEITPQQPATPVGISPTDPNDSEVIPAEVMKVLRSQTRVDLVQISETNVMAGLDTSLIGKAGFVHMGAEKRFQPDGFGRNIEKAEYTLLPCLTLETTEEKIFRALGRYRYTVSGIITQYQGKQYLLLYRTVRTYSNKNFTR